MDLIPTINCQDQSAATRVTRPACCQTRDTSHRARVNQLGQGSLNPPVAGTGSLDPGSLDQRTAWPEARSVEQGSLESGSLNPHASQQGSLDPPVAGTGSLDPGSLDQRVASPRTTIRVSTSAGTGSSRLSGPAVHWESWQQKVTKINKINKNGAYFNLFLLYGSGFVNFC